MSIIVEITLPGKTNKKPPGDEPGGGHEGGLWRGARRKPTKE